MATGLRYYSYLDSVCSISSEAVMINVRRYEVEVLTGMLSFDKWKEVLKEALKHYKLRCPKLRYIEVLAEPSASNQSNIGGMENYYKFYRHAYEAVNEVNAELQPEMPLLVGGPSGFRTDEAIHLIEDFAKDTNESKKLDFIAFHDFWAEDAPAQVADWEKEIDLALAKASLPICTPVFVTAIGYMHRAKDHDQTEKNLWQACGMTAYQFYARHSPDLRLIPFNQFHSWPFVKYVQFDPDLRLTPYEAAVKLLRMHRRQEVVSHSSGLDRNGNGLGVLATKDDDAVIVHLWNLQPDGKTSVSANVQVTNIPKQLRSGRLVIRRYLIDSRHSNCFVDSHSNPGLELVDMQEREGADILKLEAELEPMAICLWQIEKAKKAPRTD